MASTGEDRTLVERYFTCVDAGEYDILERILAPEFTHYRPDRTLSGRETFLAFMRDGRPRHDTTHRVDAIFRPIEEDGAIAVQGSLVSEEGSTLFAFVDVFELDDGRIGSLRTFTG